ncbi:MAG: hypothetical protein BWZ07_02713 [Alphaproteobacteria bacterium ADurb.BinA280]|nr:MAG: hypothetical protein BWZ07_02713 [Alphaproteobacteria bacterium ADurb.BinA280]
MEHLLTMQHLQRIKDRPHHLGDSFLGEVFRSLRQDLAQCLAFVEAHGHVGGAVALPEAEHLDQRRVGKLGQHLRFIDEALEAGVKGCLVVGGADCNADAVDAASKGRGHEFFQGHDAIKRGVLGEVDDAEAPLTDQADDLEVSDARTDRQAIGVGC